MSDFISELEDEANAIVGRIQSFLTGSSSPPANGSPAPAAGVSLPGQPMKPPPSESAQKALQNAGLGGETIEFGQPIHTSWQNAGPYTTTPFQRPVDGPGAKPRNHLGIDMAAPTGTPIYSIGPGTVKQIDNVSTNAMGGNVVYVSHLNGKFVSYYAHLNDVRCKVGDKVDGNSVIGTCGSTGNAKSPHLHFAIYVGGVAVDPAPFIGTVKYMAHYPATTPSNVSTASHELTRRANLFFLMASHNGRFSKR